MVTRQISEQAVRTARPARHRGASDASHQITLRDAVAVWAKVAVNSFGGPAGQIAVMHRFLVEERRWISEDRFLHALNYCMLLPGPEAQQLATYIGWLLHGPVGGVIAGLLFVLPGAMVILAMSVVYATAHDVAVIQAVLFGLQAAVVAVVAEAVARIGRRALRTRFQMALAAAAFVAIFFGEVPFPAIVASAGLVGFAAGRLRPQLLPRPNGHGSAHPQHGAALLGDDDRLRPTATRSALRAAAAALLLWLVPVAALVAMLGVGHMFAREAVFFSQAAVVTFGGAYAVLAYIAQEAVGTYGWLRPGEMLTGLGMAETTPGPLIMVVQFVGFMAAYRAPGPLHPLAAGLVGSAIATWVTFAPCFLFVFGGAPFIERLRGDHALNAALSAITAAVVGVVLNLAVWFSVNTAFARVDARYAGGIRLLVPRWPSVDLAAVAITAVAGLAIFRFRLSVMRTLGLCAALGILVFVVRGAPA